MHDQIYLVGSGITPLAFTNTGGLPSACSASPTLPPGLYVDVNNATAQITGKPTVGSTGIYTITASNSTGSGTATVIITTSTNISLPTTINAGTNLVLTAGEVYPIDTTLTINGGSLDLGGTSQTIASLDLESGSVTDGNLYAGSVSVTAGTISANLSGGASLTLPASATAVTLSGNNSYPGGTFVNGGTLTIASNASLPVSDPVTVNGGTLLLDTGIVAQVSTVTLNAGSILGGTIDASSEFDVFAGTISSNLSWVGALTKEGPLFGHAVWR